MTGQKQIMSIQIQILAVQTRVTAFQAQDMERLDSVNSLAKANERLDQVSDRWFRYKYLQVRLKCKKFGHR
jgi:hypothetical protein